MSSSSARTILITGATEGLSLALALELARTKVDWYRADFADFAQVRSMAARVVAEQPRIDVLVNNAGPIVLERSAR
jgi:NAD(P)-dependent dehydrogenase (short-subunit alcohol dehydrogenase family)